MSRKHTIVLFSRVLVVVLFCAALAACGGDSSSDSSGAGAGNEDGPKVAALFTQSVSQGNWDPAGYKAFKAMADKYGFSSSYVEQATYEKAPAILRDLAAKGTKLIICHSSGYAAAVEEVAPDFPDTQFVIFSYASDTKGLANYSAWSMDWDQYGYMIGVIAASSSKTGHIAVVGGEPIPSTKRTIEFITKGAKQVNPNIEVTSTYIGSWTDAAKGKEISLQALNSGADFLIPVADTAGAGVQQAAEENGALTLGEYIDQSPDYPKSIVTSTVVDMDGAYDEIGKGFSDGTLKGQIVQMNIGEGDLTFVEPFEHVDPAVQEKVDGILEQIKSGELDVAAS
ncbi:BMP family ABC transporter substrate-binding protein [soil metagenome]